MPDGITERTRELLENLIKEVREGVEEIDDVVEIYGEKFTELVDEVVDEAKKTVTQDIAGVVGDIISRLIDAVKNVLLAFTSFWGYGSFGGEVARGWARIEQAPKVAEQGFYIYIPTLEDIIFLFHKGLIDRVQFENLSKFHLIEPSMLELLTLHLKPSVTPEQIRELYRRKMIDTTTAFDLLKRFHGYDNVQASLLLALAYNRLSVSEALTAYYRGLITEAELDEYLDIAGYFGKDKQIIKEISKVIPSISDLIRFAVREAFNPEAIRTFQLDLDFPSEILPWTRAQGLSDEWTMKYWIAHWELPSITQGLEMFHRTIDTQLDPNADVISPPSGWVTKVNPPSKYNVIGRNTLRMLLKAQDISPFWRDKIEAISYTPLTRVDVRRAYDLGVMGEGDVYYAYRDLGYDHRNAVILTQFTILDVISEERNRVRNELIELYEEGALTRDELRQALQDLQFNETVIDILLDYAEFRKIRKRIERIKKVYKAMYMRGDISDDELHDLLVRLGLEPEEVVEIERDWQAEKIAKERTLSKSEIREALKKGIIDENTARRKLERLGYNEEDINILIRLWRS